jgi:hypothetical protein
MQAANADRASRGEAPAYSEDAFRSLIDQNAIGYNTVVQDMRT